MYSLKDRECWKLDAAMFGIEIEEHMHVFFLFNLCIVSYKSIHDFIDFISIVITETKCISIMIHTFCVGHWPFFCSFLPAFTHSERLLGPCVSAIEKRHGVGPSTSWTKLPKGLGSGVRPCFQGGSKRIANWWFQIQYFLF